MNHTISKEETSTSVLPSREDALKFLFSKDLLFSFEIFISYLKNLWNVFQSFSSTSSLLDLSLTLCLLFLKIELVLSILGESFDQHL